MLLKISVIEEHLASADLIPSVSYIHRTKSNHGMKLSWHSKGNFLDQSLLCDTVMPVNINVD